MRFSPSDLVTEAEIVIYLPCHNRDTGQTERVAVSLHYVFPEGAACYERLEVYRQKKLAAAFRDSAETTVAQRKDPNAAEVTTSQDKVTEELIREFLADVTNYEGFEDGEALSAADKDRFLSDAVRRKHAFQSIDEATDQVYGQRVTQLGPLAKSATSSG